MTQKTNYKGPRHLGIWPYLPAISLAGVVAVNSKDASELEIQTDEILTEARHTGILTRNQLEITLQEGEYTLNLVKAHEGKFHDPYGQHRESLENFTNDARSLLSFHGAYPDIPLNIDICGRTWSDNLQELDYKNASCAQIVDSGASSIMKVHELQKTGYNNGTLAFTVVATLMLAMGHAVHVAYVNGKK